MSARYLRRARPHLGTLVELGVRVPEAEPARATAALGRAFLALAEVERALSAFLPESDIGRFNAAPAGFEVLLSDDAARVLGAACALARESAGLFDVSLGTGPGAWSLSEGEGGCRLRKHSPGVRLDLGGIGKGFAVDRAFEALFDELARGPEEPACWVNAGGDLRVSGVELPVRLRDERGGGAFPFLVLSEGALATSRFGPLARASLAHASPGHARYVSVAAPTGLLSDALTKVVALCGRADHPLLASHGATAFIHEGGA